MRFAQEIKAYLTKAMHQFSWADLRWSYILIGGMIVLGAFVNYVMPHGWTIWPLIPVMGLLIVVNESADRNGQGVPPLQVYALLAMGVAAWLIGVMILSQVNVFVLLLGVGGLGAYTAHGYLKHRERLRLRFARRLEGLCVHCGEPADEDDTYCENCGQEPDPDRTGQQRTSAIVQHGRKTDRARSVLTPESLGNVAARKEKALLAKSPRRRGKGPKK